MEMLHRKLDDPTLADRMVAELESNLEVPGLNAKSSASPVSSASTPDR
jgi:hypothetical protein